MERREHYDPEDIEQLLLERSFDELLEEERAYVLRHLGGREEYESMRNLLHAVQRSEPDHELLDADPGVRDRVLLAFREQHKPQWRVWLNSVGASLLPNDASAMWRPALTLAGLALVIGISVWMLRTGGTRTELAEVKPLPQHAAVPLPKQEERTEQARATDPSVVEKPAVVLLEPALDGASVAAEADAVGEVATGSSENTTYLADEVNERLEESDRRPQDDLAQAPATDSLLRFDAMPAATNSGYLDNWSMANAQGTVTREVVTASRKKEEKGKLKKADLEKSLAPDDGTLALLRAAW